MYWVHRLFFTFFFFFSLVGSGIIGAKGVNTFRWSFLEFKLMFQLGIQAKLWDSNCSGLFEVPTKIVCAKICNGLWCATTFLEIARAKMGVLSVGLVKLMFACAILWDSGGVQLHTCKSHTRKWVVVVLY